MNQFERSRLMLQVWEKTQGKCAYCQVADANTVDHVVPRCAGGPDDLNNLVPACAACNSSKGQRTPEEWRADRQSQARALWSKHVVAQIRKALIEAPPQYGESIVQYLDRLRSYAVQPSSDSKADNVVQLKAQRTRLKR